MKNYLFKTLTLAVLSVFLLTACSKKDDSKPDKNQVRNGVVATITMSDGERIDFKGKLMMNMMVWSKDKDGTNILSIIATDKDFKNATLTFGISYADGPGEYSLEPVEGVMATPAQIIWDGMEWENWQGYTTGDADGDGELDGSGTFVIDELNEKHSKGTFSMTMGNDLGDKITVEGSYSGPVMRQIED